MNTLIGTFYIEVEKATFQNFTTTTLAGYKSEIRVQVIIYYETTEILNCMFDIVASNLLSNSKSDF